LQSIPSLIENKSMASHSETETLCPVFHRAVELIGRRWSGAILRVLLDGTERFSDIAAAIPGLTDRMLSERLKELEAEGILTRTVVPETPVRVEYQLTPKGRALGCVLDSIGAWAHAWLAESDKPHRERAARVRTAAR
jgi:DNA-binding HxlR family transcriptional regulator